MLDTNVLVSGVLYGGVPRQIIEHVLHSEQLILSDYIVDEFITYLKSVRPKSPQKWLRLLRQKLELYCLSDDMNIEDVVRDVNDTAILKLAIKQKALLVTGDKDLLEHKSTSRVTILSTAEYVVIFGPFDK